MDMLERQRMEALTLNAMQRAERGGSRGEILEVSFSFPTLLEDIRETVEWPK